MQLGWFPTQGMAPLVSRASGAGWLLERARYLALPAITYAIYEATRVARLMRANVIETLGQGYIVTARAKGLSRGTVIRRHVLRNSGLPVVTIMGYAFGVAMGGAVLIETVFSWPGIGLLLIEAIRARDNQVVVGVVLFVSFAVILMNSDRRSPLLRARSAHPHGDMNRETPNPSTSMAPQMRADGNVRRNRLSTRAHAATAFLSRFYHTHYGFAGFAILALLVLVAITASFLAPFDPLRQVDESLLPPSSTHPMGTDNIGRDLLSLVLFGTRASLAIGFCAALAALLIGGTIGALAGYRRGLTEAALMRLAELFQTLPVIIVVLFAIALFGSSFWLLIAAVALAIWPLEARLIYGQFINLREREFVSAAIVADLSTPHIVMREILPNALPPVIVQVALDASLAILIESGLGFLGLSDPNMISWGQLLFAAQDFLNAAWWMSVFPGLAICIAIIGLNLLADGLNEVVNPRAVRAAIGLAA